MSPTFSPLTIKALADVVSGGGAHEAGEPVGVYRSGLKIEQPLLDCTRVRNRSPCRPADPTCPPSSRTMCDRSSAA